jgi:hypothetical protein
MSDALSLNVDPDESGLELTFIEKEERRRTIWVCYNFDTLIAALMERDPIMKKPPTIKLPIVELEWNQLLTSDECPRLPFRDFLDPFRAQCRLMEIFGRVRELDKTQRRFNHFIGHGSTDSSAIVMLKLELDQWYAALPDYLRSPPSAVLGASYFSDLAIDDPPPTAAIFLHISFETTKLLLYRPTMMQALLKCPRTALFDDSVLVSHHTGYY